jgi:hypothetical protein
MMPQRAVYKDIISAGKWNLDLMELEPNPYETGRRYKDPNKNG